jgi:predicted MFS family arabinose efflux permease
MSTGTATAGASPAAAAQRTTPYAWLVLFVLMFIYIFNFLDRQLMSILLEPIKTEMGLTDEQMGYMTGFWFALVYTGFGVVVGFLADRTSRRNILFAGAFLWSLFTALCGMAKSYPVMLTARIGVGIGEAAGAPPSYSIISDYFPAHKRGMALAIFSLGVPFGQALGAAFGAVLHETIGWRNAFIAIGVAGIVASFLMLLIVREPKRGAMDASSTVTQAQAEASAKEKAGFLSTFWEFLNRPALLWTALGCGLTAFCGYAALNWNVAFLVRVKGINYGEVALYYALMLATAMGLGTWLSGVMADFLAKRSKAGYALVPLIAMTAAVPFWLAYVWAPTWQMSIALLSIPTFLTIMYLPPALAVVANSVRPNQRTMSSAILLMVLNFIGLGGGPTLVGTLSTAFTKANVAGGMEAAPAAANALQTSLYWVTPFFAVAILFLALEAMAWRREEKAGGAVRDGGARLGIVLTVLGVLGLGARYYFGGAESFTSTDIMAVIQLILLVLATAAGLFLVVGAAGRKKVAA